jgi:hypothetical protein
MFSDTKEGTKDYEPNGSGHSANLTGRLRTDYTEVSNEMQIRKASCMTSHGAVALFQHTKLLVSRTKDVNLEVTMTNRQRRATRTPQTAVQQITRDVSSPGVLCVRRGMHT